MAGFQVTPESFGPVANRMRDIGQQVLTAWQPVAQQSQAVQFGRGDDVVSPLIQVSLLGAVSIMESSMRSAAEALSGYADGLDSMATTYRDTEESTRTMLTPPAR